MRGTKGVRYIWIGGRFSQKTKRWSKEYPFLRSPYSRLMTGGAWQGHKVFDTVRAVPEA